MSRRPGLWALLLLFWLTGLGMAAARPVEIEFWHAMRGQRTQMLERLAEEFHKRNPDILVRPKLVADPLSRLGNDYSALYRALLEAIARGNPPDLSQVYENWTTQLIEVDALVPVQSFFAASGWGEQELADFVPIFLDANRFGPERIVWTLPFNKSVWVLYYNRKVLSEMGRQPPRNWDELRSLARDISTRGQMPGLVFQPGVDTFGHYLVSNNGRFVQADRAAFGGALGVADMNYWTDLVHTDHSAFPTLRGVEVFAGGGAGMMLETTSKVARLEQEGLLEFGVAPMPAGTTNHCQFAGTNLAIFKHSSPERQQAAWKFEQFLTSPEVTRMWAQETGYVPVRRSAIESGPFQEFLKAHPSHRIGLQVIEQAVSQPRVAGWESIRGLIDDAMFEALSRKATAEQAVNRAVELTDDLLKKLQGGS